jgi:hypothetical protein
MAYFKGLSYHFHEETEETTTNIVQDSRCPGRDLNAGLSEAEMLSTQSLR